MQAELAQTYPWLTEAQRTRYARSYGTLCRVFLRGMTCAEDMGEDFGAGLTEREIRYLREREWTDDAETLLWRRSKLGLHLTEAQRARGLPVVPLVGLAFTYLTPICTYVTPI